MQSVFKAALLATTIIVSVSAAAHAAAPTQITPPTPAPIPAPLASAAVTAPGTQVATSTPTAPSATDANAAAASTKKHHHKKKSNVTPASAAAAAPAVAPAPENSFMEALTGGKFWGEARYRYEDVHQDSLARQATANTLRTVLGYDTGEYKHFKAQLAALDVLHITNDTYNDGTNGRTAYPGITDPQDLQLFLANLTYSGLPDTTVIAGRQKIAIDNERWVGAANWRQIAQTFDGVVIKNKSIKDLELMYDFLFHEQKSGGTGGSNGTYDMHTHVFHAAYTGIKNVKLIGYEYLVDLRNLGETQSTSSTGLRVETSLPLTNDFALTGNGEYARQVSYADNPHDFGLNYYSLEPGFNAFGVKAKFNYEYLDGNGVNAVQTPMMSGHSMNGWADQFATTPANGLVDAFVDVSYSFKIPCDMMKDYLGDTNIRGQWHDYNAAAISQHYGSEYGIDLVQNIGKNYAVGLQVEDYIADHFAVDTKKVILTGQIKF